jgi:hypothetical protein
MRHNTQITTKGWCYYQKYPLKIAWHSQKPLGVEFQQRKHPFKIMATKSHAPKESVKVAVRLRPMSSNETTAGYEKIVDIDQKEATV